MSKDILYQAPVSGIYVASDGALHFSSKGKTVETELSSFHTSSDFTFNVQQTPLTQLAEFDNFTLDDDMKLILEIGGAAISAIAGIGAAAVAIVGALELLGVLTKPDPFSDLYKKIEEKIKTALLLNSASSSLVTMQNIRTIMGHSNTSAQIAAEHVARNFPTTAHAQAQMAQADYWSRYAVVTLIDDAYWRSVYLEEATDIGEWKFAIKERPHIMADRTVYDYRLALPAYMKAVASRLVVLRAMDPEWRKLSEYKYEIQTYLNHFRNIEATIRKDLIKTRLPEGFTDDNWWKHRGWYSGAADIRTGANRIRTAWHYSAPMDEIDLLVEAQRGGHPKTQQEFHLHYQHVTDLRWWWLYRALGLFEFWKIIPDLDLLVNPPLPDFKKFVEVIKIALPRKSPFAIAYEAALPARTHRWEKEGGGLAGVIKQEAKELM